MSFSEIILAFKKAKLASLCSQIWHAYMLNLLSDCVFGMFMFTLTWRKQCNQSYYASDFSLPFTT